MGNLSINCTGSFTKNRLIQVRFSDLLLRQGVNASYRIGNDCRHGTEGTSMNEHFKLNFLFCDLPGESAMLRDTIFRVPFYLFFGLLCVKFPGLFLCGFALIHSKGYVCVTNCNNNDTTGNITLENSQYSIGQYVSLGVDVLSTMSTCPNGQIQWEKYMLSGDTGLVCLLCLES